MRASPLLRSLAGVLIVLPAVVAVALGALRASDSERARPGPETPGVTATPTPSPTETSPTPVPTDEATRKKPRTIVETLTIGTHNVARGRASYQMLADVIGLQEVWDLDNTRLDVALGEHYTILRAFDDRRYQVPIVFRTDRFELVDEGYTKAHEGFNALPNGRHCGHGPGCTGVTPARYLHWAKLASIQTGEQFVFINTHMISHAWGPGAIRAKEERRNLWTRHGDLMDDLVQGWLPELPVFLVGDLNRKGDMHHYLDFDGMCEVPVAGRPVPQLDHLYASCTADPTGGEELDTFGSDHHALRGTVSLPPARKSRAGSLADEAERLS